MAQEQRAASGRNAAPVALDALDRAILALLLADARLSVRAIARKLDKSPGAISERLGRMEGNGVIVGYHADLDVARLGYGMHVLIGVQVARDDALDECVDAVLDIEEIQVVSLLTGSWDLMLDAYVRDHLHLRALLLEKLRTIPQIRHTEAMIVLDSQHNPTSWQSRLSDTEAV